MSLPSSEQQLYAPCIAACPVHTDTRKLAELVTQGDYENALELLVEANPFSSVCGRICHHPCEQNCRRSKVDAPVRLMKLKRFVMETARDYRIRRRMKLKYSTVREERVAVIGSGPSGLTAAYDLARQGFQITVFEKASTPGGLLGQAIPRYRLPFSVLMEDIEDILSAGIELRTEKTVGKDISIDSLLHNEFNAVLLATGLSESRTLDIPGIDSRGIIPALPFLNMVLSPVPPTIGKRVVVIGGGNVAVDVARTARRLGAQKIIIVCLESRNQMPAWEWEIKEAEEEGIVIMDSWGPRSVFSEQGNLKGLEFKRCTRVFDDQGRFNPCFDETDTMVIPADNTILAIGQRADLTCTLGSSLKILPGDRLECDFRTHATSLKGVFACGELFTGPSSSVEAVRDGHTAAKAISHYLLQGELLDFSAQDITALGELPDETAQKIKKIFPQSVELITPEKRIKDFSEIEKGYTEKDALREARRCLACTTGAFVEEEKCAACLNCVRICPFGVATVEKTAIMPEEKCQACGLCAAECPAAAIALKRFGTSLMKDQLQGLFTDIKEQKITTPMIISYCCLFEITSRKFMAENSEDYKKTGIYRIMVPCVARLSVPDILSPFELGADGVLIIACREGECLYPSAEDRLLKRIRQARGVLEEVGLNRERIDYWKTEGSAEVSWTAFWEISRRKLNLIINEGEKNDNSRKKTS